MLLRVAVHLLVEIPLCLVLAIVERLRKSPVVHQLATVVVECLVYIMTRVLDDATVQSRLSTLIAQGISCFLEQPNLECHVRSMAACVSKTQPDLARQQGQDFPIIVGSFLQGILHGVANKHANQHQATTTPVSPPPLETSSNTPLPRDADTVASSTTSAPTAALESASTETESTLVAALVNTDTTAIIAAADSNGGTAATVEAAVATASTSKDLPKRFQFPTFGIRAGGGGGGTSNSPSSGTKDNEKSADNSSTLPKDDQPLLSSSDIDRSLDPSSNTGDETSESLTTTTAAFGRKSARHDKAT